jgi:cytoskeleton protein RodZ
MTDTPQSDEKTEPEALLAGMRLANARREQDISVLDIAKALHLDEPKVRALEENHFEVLGAPVFAKGHLRKYAELVGVPTDDILADYYSLNRAVGAPPVVGRPRKKQRNYDVGRWIRIVVTVLMIAAVAAAAWWWFEQRAAEPVLETGTVTLAPFVSPSDNNESPADEADAAVGQTENNESRSEAESQSVAPDEAADVEPVASAVANEAERQSAAVPSDVPQATLSISFSGECWTEVSDANGKRLFFDLGQEGRTVSVTGAAPLRALFGDSTNVSVAINGQDYVIPDSMLSGRTARLTVNAQ